MPVGSVAALSTDADAVWILTSAFIIFSMQSGFGLLETGKEHLIHCRINTLFYLGILAGRFPSEVDQRQRYNKHSGTSIYSIVVWSFIFIYTLIDNYGRYM